MAAKINYPDLQKIYVSETFKYFFVIYFFHFLSGFLNHQTLCVKRILCCWCLTDVSLFRLNVVLLFWDTLNVPIKFGKYRLNYKHHDTRPFK